MKKQSVIVFVADKEQSQAFTNATDLVIFGADTYRNALSQVIFSYPDVIVIDSSRDMLRAEDAFFHLRTINHPPIIVLSDVPDRWYTKGGNSVHIMPEDSSPFQIEEMVRAILTGDTASIR